MPRGVCTFGILLALIAPILVWCYFSARFALPRAILVLRFATSKLSNPKPNGSVSNNYERRQYSTRRNIGNKCIGIFIDLASEYANLVQ